MTTLIYIRRISDSRPPDWAGPQLTLCMDKKTNLWELHYGPVFVTPMYFLENCDESYKTFSQDGHLLLTFTADVKLEALEEDRFFVCCLENVDFCDQVTEN